MKPPKFSSNENAQPAATAQRGQPSFFGRFICIRNSVLARPACLIWVVRRKKRRLTELKTEPSLAPMSILELKQRVSRLSQRERQELQLYLLRLKRETPAWKRATAKKIREMQAGKFTTLEELKARVSKK